MSDNECPDCDCGFSPGAGIHYCDCAIVLWCNVNPGHAVRSMPRHMSHKSMLDRRAAEDVALAVRVGEELKQETDRLRSHSLFSKLSEEVERNMEPIEAARDLMDVGRSPMEDEIEPTRARNKARAEMIDKVREEGFVLNEFNGIPNVSPEEAPMMSGTAKTDAPNPKDLLGAAKTPTLSVIPTTALILMGEAMRDGAAKYGAFNWRQHKVQASVYADAAVRHLMAWWDSEQEAEDSGTPHLGHAMASLGILADAEEIDMLIDDRPGSRAGDSPHVGPSPLMLKRYKRGE